MDSLVLVRWLMTQHSNQSDILVRRLAGRSDYISQPCPRRGVSQASPLSIQTHLLLPRLDKVYHAQPYRQTQCRGWRESSLTNTCQRPVLFRVALAMGDNSSLTTHFPCADLNRAD